MFETSARLLRLLSLLQSRADWTGHELAERLQVTARTVRRDVDRLRDLGYPVEATPGRAGGYRLGIGAALPPLLLDDTEAVAVAVGLRLAAASTVRELDEAADAALAKLDRVLPSRLRRRVDALTTSTVSLTGSTPMVAPDDLMLLAQACRDRERVHFRYTDGGGRDSERTVEPHRLVHTGRRWYLVARDTRRDGWRMFRLDRIGAARRTGQTFVTTDEPDVAALISHGLAVAPYRWKARIRIDAPAEEVARRVPPSAGSIEAIDERTSILVSGSDHLDAIIGHLVLLGLPFEALEPPELRTRVAELARGLLAAHPAGAATDGATVSAAGPGSSVAAADATRAAAASDARRGPGRARRSDP